MRSAKRYLLEVVLLVLVGGVFWAISPYLDVFSGDIYQSDAAWEDLAIETKGRFGHRFVVGMEIGAGVSAVWILSDLAKAKRKKRPKADGCTTEAEGTKGRRFYRGGR